jgi:hypothetical protein
MKKPTKDGVSAERHRPGDVLHDAFVLRRLTREAEIVHVYRAKRDSYGGYRLQKAREQRGDAENPCYWRSPIDAAPVPIDRVWRSVILTASVPFR